VPLQERPRGVEIAFGKPFGSELGVFFQLGGVLVDGLPQVRSTTIEQQKTKGASELA